MGKKCFISLGEVNKKWILYLLIIIITFIKKASESFKETLSNFFFPIICQFLVFLF